MQHYNLHCTARCKVHNLPHPIVIKHFFPKCDPPDRDVKWTTAVQIFTYAKLLAMFIIIATGMVQLGRDNTEYIRFCMMVVVYLQQGLEKDIINNWSVMWTKFVPSA